MNGAIEHEAKILNIDVDAVREKLKSIGAKEVATYQYARYVFETIPASKGRWVRLRTDGVNTSLTVKEITDDTITGTSEWEVAVDNFETTLEIIKKMGLAPKGYQENKRELYKVNDVEVSIDYWPMLKPYLEIEGKDGASVELVAEMLGYPKVELDSRNTKALYRDIGVELDDIKDLKF